MKSLTSLLLLVALLASSSVASAAPDRAPHAAPVPGECIDGTLPSGALSRICIPASEWNGALLVYAHGYVAPGPDLSLNDALGAQLASFIQSQGYAFATTSYHRNGIAILEGIDDIRELVAAFPAVAGRAPTRSYLLGFSEGGLISTLLAERSASQFNGVLAACGPIGDFQQQINYLGDFRVLFDYYFPGTIAGSPIDIPQPVMAGWTKPNPAISNALQANPIAASQLITTSMAAINPADASATTNTTAQDLLWYNIFATNDLRAQLGGNAYGNTGRVYHGSSDDTTLNSTIARYSADQNALAAVARYQTNGRPRVPLVLLHTTGDDLIPFAQATLYVQKAQRSRNVTLIPVSAYGHCAFSPADVLGAFNVLVQQATSVRPQVWLPI